MTRLLSRAALLAAALTVYRGTRRLLDVPERLDRLESQMATSAQQINAVTERLEDFVADVEVLKTKAGQLDAEGQAALDRMSDVLSLADENLGDQDGSDTEPTPEPAPTDPATPTGPVSDDEPTRG